MASRMARPSLVFLAIFRLLIFKSSAIGVRFRVGGEKFLPDNGFFDLGVGHLKLFNHATAGASPSVSWKKINFVCGMFYLNFIFYRRFAIIVNRSFWRRSKLTLRSALRIRVLEKGKEAKRSWSG